MFFLRCVKTAGLLLLLPLGWGLSLLPLLLVTPHVEPRHLLPALTVWAALHLLPFPFVFSWIVRKVWFFPGEGEPVPQETLEFMLLGVNDLPIPVRAEKKRKTIRLSWRVDDPVWCQRMALVRLRQQYELTLEFDPVARTVTVRDRVRPVDFSLCPVKVRIGLFSSPRFCGCVRCGPEFDISSFGKTAPEEWRFRPQELKTPVVNTILRNGWNVRFVLH